MRMPLDKGERMEIDAKLKLLKYRLGKMKSIAVAFSGGVDSTFLLKVAHDVLGDGVVAITARSQSFPDREFNEAKEFSGKIGVKHVVIDSEELDIEGFSDNPVNRCYLCKRELFSKMVDYAKANGIRFVADGSNVDDTGDYRPGMEAIREFRIVCPLREAGLDKKEIRRLSKEMGLPTWDKPAFACLVSRIPYGQKITKEKLQAIDEMERFLLDLGFRQVRVRSHGDLARIEVGAGERNKFFNTELMDRIYEKLKEFGYAYVTMDLKGYRSGSMNEILRGC